MTAKRFDRKNIEQQDEPTIPHRPVSLSYDYEDNGDSLLLRQKKHLMGEFGTLGRAMGLILWTLACVLLIGLVFHEPEIFKFCFGIPFWTAWFLFFGLVFGKTTVRLDRDGLFYTYQVVVRIVSRQMPLDEIRYFHAIQTQDDESNSYLVEAVTFGKFVQFSTPNFEEAEWLAYDMNQALVTRKGVSRPKMPQDGTKIGTDHENADDDETDGPINIPLTARPQNIGAPSDCRWKMNVEYDAVTFEKHGKFSPVEWGMATFTMLCWNGLVSTFVLFLWGFVKTDGWRLFTPLWWGLFVFLIPFQAVGLYIFLLWLSVLFAPFQRTRWSFHHNTVTWRAQWFGIGRSRRYSLETCEKMVIDKMVIDTLNPGKKRHTDRQMQFPREEGLYQLMFVDDQNKKLYSIKKLMLGEACWIADQILLHR